MNSQQTEFLKNDKSFAIGCWLLVVAGFAAAGLYAPVAGFICMIREGTFATGQEMLNKEFPIRKIFILSVMQLMQQESNKIINFCCLLAVICAILKQYKAKKAKNLALAEANNETTTEQRSHNTVTRVQRVGARDSRSQIIKLFYDHDDDQPSDKTVTTMLSVDEAKRRLAMKIQQPEEFKKKFLEFLAKENHGYQDNILRFLLGIAFFWCSLGVLLLLMPNGQPTAITEVLRLHDLTLPFLPNVIINVAALTLCCVIVYEFTCCSTMWVFINSFSRNQYEDDNRAPMFFKHLVNCIIILLLNMFVHSAWGLFNFGIVHGRKIEENEETLYIHVLIFLFLINSVCGIYPLSMASNLLVMFAMWFHVACTPLLWFEWPWVFGTCMVFEKLKFKKMRNLDFIVVLLPGSKIAGHYCWDQTQGQEMRSLLSSSGEYNKILVQDEKNVKYFNYFTLIVNLVLIYWFYCKKQHKYRNRASIINFCNEEHETAKSLKDILKNPETVFVMTAFQNPELTMYAFFFFWNVYEVFVPKEWQIWLLKIVYGQSEFTFTDRIADLLQSSLVMKFECTGFSTKP